MIYDNIIKNDNLINNTTATEIIVNFIRGANIEIKSIFQKQYRVEFWNSGGSCEYRTVINSNSWAKTSKKYFDQYTCRVYDGDILIHEHKYDARGKRVYIALESKSLGDTLAWFPYANEFGKKWGCKVVCSTFWNYLFKDQYPDIEFVEPGTPVNNLYAMYTLGWYYNENGVFDHTRNPKDFRQISLQQTASDILGLEFKHVKAKLNLPNAEKKKKVGFGIHSTAQAKYWNNPTGWQQVTDYLLEHGYEPVILSKEGDGYMGNNHPIGATKFPAGSILDLIKEMLSCEFFIGIGSGLTWLAWTLDLPIVLISGFSNPISEFIDSSVDRVFNDSVCNSCFNRHRLDAGDWNWCPDQKGTERQFECTKSITFEMVKPILEKKVLNNT